MTPCNGGAASGPLRVGAAYTEFADGGGGMSQNVGAVYRGLDLCPVQGGTHDLWHASAGQWLKWGQHRGAQFSRLQWRPALVQVT